MTSDAFAFNRWQCVKYGMRAALWMERYGYAKFTPVSSLIEWREAHL